MKKYIAPSTTTKNVFGQNILAGSFNVANDMKGYTDGGYEGGYAKENTLWDMDEE